MPNLLTNKSELNKEKIVEEARENGLFLYIDKPTDWTSHDVVAKVRNTLKIKKVGHSGTLDPMATGLLILGLGKGTKSLSDLLNTDKTYTGTIKIGATTKTDDAEAEEEDITDFSKIEESDIISAVNKLTGKIEQIPPKYSAKKIKGKKMYSLARKNIDFEPEPSQIEIFSFIIENIELPYIDFQIHCSKGTYIRAIARDLGSILGVGGYLSKLRRTKIGNHNVSKAFELNLFIEGLKE